MEHDWSKIPYPLRLEGANFYVGDHLVDPDVVGFCLNPVVKYRKGNPFTTKRNPVQRLLHKVLPDHSRMSEKNSYKLAHELFGPKVCTRIRGKAMGEIILPLGKSRRVINKRGPSWKNVDPDLYYNLVKNYDNVKQTADDDMHQITPFLVQSEDLDASTLRSKLGRARWRRLLKTSVARSRMYSQVFQMVGNRGYPAELFDRLEKIPSCCLSLLSPSFMKSTTYGAILHLSNNPSTYGLGSRKMDLTDRYHIVSQLRRDWNIIGDTRIMAVQLGATFNPNWSLNRMKREHDNYTQVINAQRHSPEPFCNPDIHTIEGRGLSVTFTRLNSPFLIAEEGREMRHCVGSYALRAGSGQYSVYKVECPELDVRATLGLTHTSERMVYMPALPISFYSDDTPLDTEIREGYVRTFNQMYGRMNSRVPTLLHDIVDEVLIPALNEGSHLFGKEDFVRLHKGNFGLDIGTEFLYTSRIEEAKAGSGIPSFTKGEIPVTYFT